MARRVEGVIRSAVGAAIGRRRGGYRRSGSSRRRLTYHLIYSPGGHDLPPRFPSTGPVSPGNLSAVRPVPRRPASCAPPPRRHLPIRSPPPTPPGYHARSDGFHPVSTPSLPSCRGGHPAWERRRPLPRVARSRCGPQRVRPRVDHRTVSRGRRRWRQTSLSDEREPASVRGRVGPVSASGECRRWSPVFAVGGLSSSAPGRRWSALSRPRFPP